MCNTITGKVQSNAGPGIASEIKKERIVEGIRPQKLTARVMEPPGLGMLFKDHSSIKLVLLKLGHIWRSTFSHVKHNSHVPTDSVPSFNVEWSLWTSPLPQNSVRHTMHGRVLQIDQRNPDVVNFNLSLQNFSLRRKIQSIYHERPVAGCVLYSSMFWCDCWGGLGPKLWFSEFWVTSVDTFCWFRVKLSKILRGTITWTL